MPHHFQIALFKCRLYLAISLMCGVSTSGFSQHIRYDYKPDRNFSAPVEVIAKIRKNFMRWGSTVQFESQMAKYNFVLDAREKADFIFTLDSIGGLMYSDALSRFVQGIKDSLITNSPFLQKVNFSVFICRNPLPNAFALGEGVIAINTGLLERLTSVDQLAFILAHEMSHEWYDDVYNGTYKFWENFYKKETQKEFNRARRARIGKSRAIDGFVKGFLADHLHYKRENEFKADSFGIEVMQAAGFDPNGAVEVLHILDNADNGYFEDDLPLKKLFHFDECPFMDNWLDDSDLYSVWNDASSREIPDSLKTHPECIDRIERLMLVMRMRGSIVPDNAEVQTTFTEYRNTFLFESISSFLQMKKYANAMYYASHILEEYPENIFLKCVITECLIHLGNSKSDHSFLEQVEFPQLRYEKGYNQLLTFLHNTNSKQLRKMGQLFYKKHLEHKTDHPYARFILMVSEFEEPLTTTSIEKYELEFAEPYYSGLLKEKLEDKRK